MNKRIMKKIIDVYSKRMNEEERKKNGKTNVCIRIMKRKKQKIKNEIHLKRY